MTDEELNRRLTVIENRIAQALSDLNRIQGLLEGLIFGDPQPVSQGPRDPDDYNRKQR